MRVISAFVEPGSEDFFRWVTAGLSSFELLGVGPDAATVIDLCDRLLPDVVIVGPKFGEHVALVREHYLSREIREPLWIGAMGPKGEYPQQEMRRHGVRTAVSLQGFTDASWAEAVEAARRALHATGDISIVTSFPTHVPHETLRSLLEPWPEFVFGTDCRSLDDLVAAIIDERPRLVLMGQQHISDITMIREALRAARVAEPRWVLMLMHVDTSTLMSAAIAGIEHMILPEHLAPADHLPDLFRNCAFGSPSGDSSLARILGQLTVANDDDDRNILRFLTSGSTNAEIAERVFLSEQTVKNRLSRMMKAANVTNRTELAMLFATAATTGPSKVANQPSTTPDR